MTIWRVKRGSERYESDFISWSDKGRDYFFSDLDHLADYLRGEK